MKSLVRIHLTVSVKVHLSVAKIFVILQVLILHIDGFMQKKHSSSAKAINGLMQKRHDSIANALELISFALSHGYTGHKQKLQ